MPKGYPINRSEALAKRSASIKASRAANKIDPIIRFWQKVELVDGCWLWKGGLLDNGYAPFWFEGKHIKAYHFSLGYFRGEIIPEGLEPDHLCRNRACVNPWHLELVTHPINCQRGEGGQYQRDKTYCPQGHPYDEENTYRRPDRPQRNCKICKREAYRRWRERK
ncbi:hypothetical protein LCGC14_1463220 [marine sediment metagenome]|uniref:HNH nuclease domain-containing protein n=1 Tax=marine sediment metagenome TaxID=412755 RepID=A0A0F9JF04_9ZZZZ